MCQVRWVCVHAESLQLCCGSATFWIAAHQAPLAIGFSRQEYWSGLPCPLPGDLLDPVIEPVSLMSLALAGGFFTTSATWEARYLQRSFPSHRGTGEEPGALPRAQKSWFKATSM